MHDSNWMFPAATLGPAALILVACFLGGGWIVAAFLAMSVLAYGLDRLVVRLPGGAGSDFPAPDALCLALAAAQLALLAAGVAALAGSALNPAEKVGLFLALGLWLGQVGNANAHELIHRRKRWISRLGAALFASVLFGHHASAHPKVHHRFVATPDDPNTARLGEGFGAFLPRAWIGSFRAGWYAEMALLRHRHGTLGAVVRHPYLPILAVSATVLTLAYSAFGPAGVAAHLGLSLHAQLQILLSDYVQHYGLSRRRGAAGRYEPVGPQHSWNAPHPWTGRMMLHGTRHSDHHMHPARSFDELVLPDGKTAPRLPAALPVMAMAALVPPLWRRMMDERARRWSRVRKTTADPAHAA